MSAYIDPRMREYLNDHGIKIERDGMIVLTEKQWEKAAYKDRSVTDPTVRTWMLPSIHGCCLLFEGKHFRIQN